VDGAARHPARRRDPRVHVLGRETFLAPLRWVDGWPEVTPVPMEPARDNPHRDDFEAPRLGPE
jgi:beta-xylosidase